MSAAAAVVAITVAWVIGALMGHRAGREEGAADVWRSLLPDPQEDTR